MRERPITVVLVEDRWEWRESVLRVLERSPDIEVVGSADAVDGAVAALRAHQPDVALIDLKLHGDVRAGMEVAWRAREISPGTAIVVFTAVEEASSVDEARRAGVSGYLLKSAMTDPTRLREVVRLAADGVVLFSAQAATQLKEQLLRLDELADPLHRFRLTPREREAFELLGRGKTNPEIAATLGMEEQSAKNLVGKVLKKVDARDRAALAIMARDLGIT